MGNSVKAGSYHTFPSLSVTGNDKGYAIRVKFTRPALVGDEINLPALPNSNWIEVTGSLPTDRQIYISGGTTNSELKTFLQAIQITLAIEATGQELLVWIGSDSTAETRDIHYNPNNGHWYEYGGGGSWLEAYNNSLDKNFSGLRGYWATGDEWTGDPLGSVFYDRAKHNDPSLGVTAIYPYTFWKDGEPNNWEGNEYLLHTNTALEDGTKKWSDNSNDRWFHYFVEYSGTMQGVSAEGEYMEPVLNMLLLMVHPARRFIYSKIFPSQFPPAEIESC